MGRPQQTRRGCRVSGGKPTLGSQFYLGFDTQGIKHFLKSDHRDAMVVILLASADDLFADAQAFGQFGLGDAFRDSQSHDKRCNLIKTDAQRERTQVQIEGFRRALAMADCETSGKRAAAIRGSYEATIRQLEEEVAEYDRLKCGHFDIPSIHRLDEVAPIIAKIRLARGISQTELARKLGVSKQVISRHEDDDYQGVAASRLQELLDALGVTVCVTLSA